MKALLVVGSAPCALADLEKARALYPDHEVMLVNGACTMVEQAQHMLAGHTAKVEEFVAARAAAFKFGSSIRVHANFPRVERKIKQLRNYYPSVTDWWGGDKSSGATSAGKAALIGIDMGFHPIVLCGCPLDGSGYASNEAAVTQDKSCQRVGDPSVQDRRTIRGYREQLVTLSKTTFNGKVFSMSGFSREHLGPPPGLKELEAEQAWLE